MNANTNELICVVLCKYCSSVYILPSTPGPVSKQRSSDRVQCHTHGMGGFLIRFKVDGFLIQLEYGNIHHITHPQRILQIKSDEKFKNLSQILS